MQCSCPDAVGTAAGLSCLLFSAMQHRVNFPGTSWTFIAHLSRRMHHQNGSHSTHPPCCTRCHCCTAEHKYTESNLCFEHLKGADRALVRAMSTCRGLEAHLVLVTRKVSGTAESSGWGCRYKRRCYYDDDDEEEEEEDSDDEGPHTMADVSMSGMV